MTVKELIEKLQKIKDQDMLVLVSSDPEGNSFDTLGLVSESFARKDGYNWEVYDEDDIENYAIEDVQPVVVIWP
jgi:hypothetical protein